MRVMHRTRFHSSQPVIPMAKMTASTSCRDIRPFLSRAVTAVTRCVTGSSSTPVTKVPPTTEAPRDLMRFTRGVKMRSLTLPLHQHTSKSAWCARAAPRKQLSTANVEHILEPKRLITAYLRLSYCKVFTTVQHYDRVGPNPHRKMISLKPSKADNLKSYGA